MTPLAVIWPFVEPFAILAAVGIILAVAVARVFWLNR